MDAFDFASSTVLKVAGSLKNWFRSAKANSLSEYSAVARIHPICVVESSLITTPYITDIAHTANNLIAVWYMQAFAIDNQIGGINIVKRLDKLNPDRSLLDAVANQPYYSTEDFQLNLPKYANRRIASQEAYDEKQPATGPARTSVGFGKDAPANLRAAENLAVGKIMEITVQHGAERAVVPVTVSLMPLLMPSDIMITTFGKNGFKNTRRGRLYRWRAGELETVKDMLFGRDMILEHMATLIKDTTGFYAATRDKRRNNTLAALASGDPSINALSNIAIISMETAQRIEQELGGKLNDYATRQRVFNDSSLVMIFVVDQDRQMLRIYYHGIKQGSLMSASDVKSFSKNNGTDLTEILRAFQQVSAPAF